MKTMRCFLALKLSLEIAENLAASQKLLKERCKEAGMIVRWIPPPNIHMTLLFLGEITEPMAAALKDMLKPITDETELFDLTVLGMGAFPDATNPKIIWAGLGEGTDKLTLLYNTVRQRLETAGFYFDNRPFAAHVTIGRVKSSPPGASAGCFQDEAARTFGTGTIRQIHCFRSDLYPTGAEYTSLWSLPFQKTADKSTRQTEIKTTIQTTDNTNNNPSAVVEIESNINNDKGEN